MHSLYLLILDSTWSCMSLYISVDCQWGPWKEAHCDKTCGHGNKRRTRTLMTPVYNGKCVGQPIHTVPCNLGSCTGEDSGNVYVHNQRNDLKIY